jgi:hypothetical protein
MLFSMQGFNSAEAKAEQSEACIPNIDTAGRRRRLRFGVITLVVGIALLVLLLALHVNPLWRLPLFLVFSAAGTGYFQWRDHT